MTTKPHACRRRSPRLSVTLCLFGIGITPLSLPAQTPDVPILVLEEPTPKPLVDRLRHRVVNALSWSATQELLLAAGVRAPARTTSFTLTPREPYAMPGGFIRLLGRGDRARQSWWQPGDADPTGSAGMDDDNAVFLHLLNLKPNYKYVIDLSVRAFTTGRLEVRVCGTWGGNVLDDAEVSGARHALIVTGTDRDGEACFQLRSATGSSIYLYRVTISELEPLPTPFGR